MARKANDVTAAEAMKSAPLVAFGCAQFLACRRAGEGEDVQDVQRERVEIDGRRKARKKVVTNKNIGYKYGYRGGHEAVKHLDPYRFVSEWEVVRAAFPNSAGAARNAARADPSHITDQKNISCGVQWTMHITATHTHQVTQIWIRVGANALHLHLVAALRSQPWCHLGRL